MADHDDKISSFCELTGVSTDAATEYLNNYDWDMDAAVAAYYTEQDSSSSNTGAASASAPASAPAPPEYTGPRTLDGRPAPQYAQSSSSAKKTQKRTGLATLSSIGGRRDEDDDDDEDDEEDEGRGPRDLFAGGEKSGLAVQDPSQREPNSDTRRLLQDILAKARENSRASGNSSDDEGTGTGTARPTRFRGTGMTLGGDGVESREIPDLDPDTSAPARQPDGPTQERTLHIWSNGFSVEEGPLYRFDDPANQADLAMIRAGRAPLRLMNVRPDQRVNVKLEQHQEEWRQLPKKYVPFSGEGRRLGSPVPGVGSASATPAAAPASTTTASAPAASGSTQAPSTGVDESQPTVMLRIQLPDGRRLPARFNTSQTIGDVYEFIQRSSTSLSARPWVLSTTFPNKDHTDKSLVLGETPEFKRGAAAVVKWV
ncbi:hypothetical protein B0H65DRAFT_456958 [Neurospora tetraspora]|uniref:SEP-domain-containing protein n=1 Tax=Neurospora tetraspora TaxID=94610 RepID=A0AAE0MUN0_9PEZI|nr:hypothetical protein B0H65DRAFT_456958 [Neurospora tetraspora]